MNAKIVSNPVVTLQMTEREAFLLRCLVGKLNYNTILETINASYKMEKALQFDTTLKTNDSEVRKLTSALTDCLDTVV